MLGNRPTREANVGLLVRTDRTRTSPGRDTSESSIFISVSRASRASASKAAARSSATEARTERPVERMRMTRRAAAASSASISEIETGTLAVDSLV